MVVHCAGALMPRIFATIVALRNGRDVPLEVDLRDARGATRDARRATTLMALLAKVAHAGSLLGVERSLVARVRGVLQRARRVFWRYERTFVAAGHLYRVTGAESYLLKSRRAGGCCRFPLHLGRQSTEEICFRSGRREPRPCDAFREPDGSRPIGKAGCDT